MPQYEHVFLARQDVSAQQVQSLLDEFSKVITENGGEVGKTEYWGLKPLAYKMKKNRKAHYHMMNIDAPHEAVAEMERQMRLSGDVIRFLTLRVEELEDKPSPMMKRSEERRGSRRGGERGDRGDRGDRGPRGGQE
jgi:small subunit ribosomal protein S6